MKKLQYSERKTLKLTNVLKFKVPLEQEATELDIVIDQMQSYIKARGAVRVGPLIQYAKAEATRNGNINVDIVLMLQCNHFINGVVNPYSMDTLICVSNAMYCRYHGPEKSLQFAYGKIQLEAFEKNIVLGNESYTVFVSGNDNDEKITADVFIPVFKK